MKDNKSEGEESGGEDPDEEAMMKLMGFGGFDTTKNKKVRGNNAYAVYKQKKTEYRQYMLVTPSQDVYPMLTSSEGIVLVASTVRFLRHRCICFVYYLSLWV